MTPRITLDEDLVDEIAVIMDLRVPNAEALAAIAGRLGAHQASGTDEPFESVVDVATGVGKTFVLAAAIEYLAQFGVRNVAIITHRNAILTKTVNNFTPGHDKSIVDRMTINPTVITVDDLDTGAAQAAMDDPEAIKVYILSIQSLQRPTSNAGRRTHDFREVLGEGFYDRLQALDDLVIFADEHHCYYGPSFSQHMRGLEPMALVGLTGTPHDQTPDDQIIYRYPLAEAIADRLVKIPVVVGRTDDLADDATKLRDGLTLLRAKQRAVDAWVDQTGLPHRNLLMLVVTESIDEAQEVEALLTSDQVHDGAYANHVLRIDSSQADEALDELDRVEDPDSPVRVIVSVQMLQEGWDVATVAVIVSLRASVSDILTEQTLGRGLRLPWGHHVDVPLLNQLDVVAHERYEEVLRRAGVALREQRVDWASWARDQVEVAQTLAAQAASESAAEETRAQLATLVNYRARDEVVGAVGAGDGTFAADSGVADEYSGEDGTDDGRTPSADRVPGADSMTVARIDERMRDVQDGADTVERAMRPRPRLPGIRLPIVRTHAVTSDYQLADVATGLRDEMRNLGASFAANPDDVLRRTELVASVVTGSDGLPRTEISTRAADDPVLTEVTGSVSPTEVASRLARAILHSRVATGRRQDRQPARMLAEAVVDGAGDDADVLGRYVGQLTAAVVARVAGAVESSTGHVEQVDDIALADIDWPRARHEVVMQDHRGEFNRRIAYSGWERSLYDEATFDSSTERAAAVILDASANTVGAWVRLRRNDLAVNWTGTGRQYHPDFIAVEPEVVRHDRVLRRCWVIEVKADNQVDAPDVVDKFDAAKRWAARVNADGVAEPDEWHVMLASETAIEQARGSWTQLLQRARTDL